MSTDLDEPKKNFYSIPSPNRYKQKSERWVAAIKFINGSKLNNYILMETSALWKFSKIVKA